MRTEPFLLKLIAVVLVGLVVVGCSSTDTEEELEPAPLEDFDAERYFDKVWSNSIGDGQGSIYNSLKPAIYEDMVYAAAANGTVEAVSLERGKTQWDADLDQLLVGGVGACNDLVMVGTVSGEAIALDRTNGEEKWRAEVGGEVVSAPQCNEQIVVVQTFDGQLQGLDVNDGKRLWSFRNTVPLLTLRGTSTPLLYRDAVVAGFANGHVIAFDMLTGTVRWNNRIATAKGNSEIDRLVDVDGALLQSGNLIYAVSYQGKVAAIEPNSGRMVWTYDASSYAGMSEGFGNIYVSGADGTVSAFEKQGQGVRWVQTALARRKLTGSATTGSYVVVGDFEGYLHALSQVDGHLSARTRVDSDGLRVDVQSVGDLLIAFSNDGKLAAYRLQEKRSFF